MIYLASSWKNPHHSEALAQLRAAGQIVYDFKNPTEGDNGFSWRQITPDPKPWSLEKLDQVLRHPVAQRGFALDFGAMKASDACVMLLPCGKSAHLEAGWFAGRGLPVIIWGAPGDLHEPELMYLCTSGVATSIGEVLAKLPNGGRR